MPRGAIPGDPDELSERAGFDVRVMKHVPIFKHRTRRVTTRESRRGAASVVASRAQSR